MVIHTTKRSGQYCLGFRIDPPEKLAAVLKEVGALFMTYTSDPVYGVEFEIEKKKDEEDVKVAFPPPCGHAVAATAAALSRKLTRSARALPWRSPRGSSTTGTASTTTPRQTAMYSQRTTRTAPRRSTASRS